MDIPEHPSDLGIATADGRDEWWPTQRETIQQIVDAFAGGKRFVFVNAPTGAGKTIVATAVQSYLDAHAVNLCHTIQLENQYQRTCPWAKVVTGRGNHQCDLPPAMAGVGDVTAAEAPCTQGVPCEFQAPDGCSYYRMFFGAAESRQVIMNYAYACRILQTPYMRSSQRDPITGERKPIRNPFWRELLVCDEAHLAHQAVIDAAKVVFYRRSWKKRTGLDIPDTDDVERWVDWAALAATVVERLVADLPPIRRGMTPDELRARARLQGMLNAAEAVSNISDPTEWMAVKDGENVNIRPIWAWTSAKALLWGPFPKVILMSATLGDPALLARRLGIPIEEAEYIDVPSVFPAINRPVFYWPVIRASRRTTDAEWDRLAQAIHYLASQPSLAGKKGVIHTASFAIAHRLYSRLQAMDPARYIAHAQAGSSMPLPTLAQALMVFEHAQEPLILLSPSMTTGIDLPYVIGFQVIAKTPFADLGDPVTAAQRAYKPEWDTKFGQKVYDADALNTVVQAAGRAVRTPTDQGVTYVLDGNWWSLYVRAYAPQSFRETVRWLKAK